MTWPDYESAWNPYFGDGVTYGRELGRVSPEGNIYGQTRFIREWKHPVWWTGAEWKDVVVEGELDSIEDFPTGRRTFGEMWNIREYNLEEKVYYLAQYYYNSEYPDDPWKKLHWLWDVAALSDLPIPGIEVGAAHMVIEEDVLVYWNGYQWRRLSHAGLRDDEPEKHLPAGFLDLLIPDVKVVYTNQNELVLEPIPEGAGVVFVGGDMITAGPNTAVFASVKSLNLVSGELVAADLIADTEYWIYLANTVSMAFSTEDWDYRGKLFLSTTTPIDGYLGLGIGLNARLAGRIQTDSDKFFARELDISLISNRASLIDAFREYSDFVVEFIDQDTLRLAKLDGAYGQIFVPDSLRYVGFDHDVTRTDDWINWDEEVEGYIELKSASLTANSTYHIYMAGMVDPFNFNEVNPNTGRPWQESDAGAEDNYVSALDFRIKPFLSSKEPDHGRMSETWPGFYTRWIGQVRMDGNAKFKNARDLSMIRQPTLNPTYFDGLAEITFAYYGEDEFRVAAIRGTSGIVNVAGVAVQTFDRDEADLVHRARNSDTVQDYDEEDLESPLSNLSAVSSYTEEIVYLYMANNRDHWESFKNKLFWCLDAPVGGYLSRNWPGNQARWVATVYVSNGGNFGGGYLRDSVVPPTIIIDDVSTSSHEVWSSEKIAAEINKLQAQIAGTEAYNNQKSYGCPLRLLYTDSTTVTCVPTVSGPVIFFPDLTYLAITPTGVTLDLTGLGVSYGTIYYVWLSDDGLAVGTTPPANVYDKLEDNGTDSILVGYLSPSTTDLIAGTWNIYSYWNEPDREWSEDIVDYIVSVYVIDDVVLDIPGFFVPSSSSGTVVRTGSSTVRAYGWDAGFYYYCETDAIAIGTDGCTIPYHNAGGSITVSTSHSTIIVNTVYSGFVLDHEKTFYDYDTSLSNVNSKYKNVTGSYKVTRQGS